MCKEALQIEEILLPKKPPPEVGQKKKRGRKARGKALSLLDRLVEHSNAVLAFAEFEAVPFSNNQAERGGGGKPRSATQKNRDCQSLTYICPAQPPPSMETPAFLQHIRDLLARDETTEAIRQLRLLLQNSPRLDELLQQSARHQAILRQIRLGTVSHKDANLSKNQIRTALLELLRDIETQEAQSLDI